MAPQGGQGTQLQDSGALVHEQASTRSGAGLRSQKPVLHFGRNRYRVRVILLTPQNQPPQAPSLVACGAPRRPRAASTPSVPPSVTFWDCPPPPLPALWQRHCTLRCCRPQTPQQAKTKPPPTSPSPPQAIGPLSAALAHGMVARTTFAIRRPCSRATSIEWWCSQNQRRGRFRAGKDLPWAAGGADIAQR